MKKKKAYLFLSLCMIFGNLQAQFSGTYDCTINLEIKDHTENASIFCENRFELTAFYRTGPSKMEWGQGLTPIADAFRSFSQTFSFDGANQLTSIEVLGIRNYYKAAPWPLPSGCESASGSGDRKRTNMPTENPCFTHSFSEADNVFPAYTSRGTIEVRPGTVNMYYINDLNEVKPNSGDLPSDNLITLKAYPDAPYTWQIRKGGTWQNLPSTHQNKSTIQIRGLDLFTEAQFLNLLTTDVNVRVRVLYQGSVKNEIVLTALLSAPQIASVAPTNESCHQQKDGKLKICFNRSLRPSERISIQLNGEINPKFEGITSFDENTCFIVGSPNQNVQIPPDNYEIKLFGRYTPQNYKGAGATFTDSQDHIKFTRIEAASAIIFNTPVPQPVHCFDGEDGRISITASGGTRSYKSYLVSGNDTIQQINLSQTTGAAFANLKAGTYTVKLKDSNQCDPKSGGSVITYDRIVAQPEQGVFVNTIEAVEPLGFGLTNGRITVRAQYGALPPYTFEWKDAESNTTLTANPPVTEGPSMRSTLSDIGKGRYFVRAQDPNYALVSERTDINLRGCFDTLTVYLDEPPLLEVELKEFHFVSCYGYNDGEIVAHAKGGRPYIAGQPYHPYQYEWFVLSNNSPVAFGDSDSIAVERPSAWYRIKVTDRNGISAWSDDFHLIQPQPLKVSFNTSNLLCNGDTNGKSTALVTGGTQPYRYAWSTDDDTPAIENLPEGWYSVVITDDRICTTFGQTQVEVPNGLIITPTLKNPTCFQYSDGSIEIATTGGKAPYSYSWNHKEDNEDFADNLPKGNYSVKVEDDNHCFIERTYFLDEPALLSLNLGDDKVLCKNQVLSINATIDDPQARYSWSKDGVVFSNTASVALSDAGTYKVSVVDGKGCPNQDEIKISRDETVISADFAVATRVPKGERVRVANIANPAPEKMEWIIPDGVSVHEQKTEYLELVFNNYGEYVLGLRSFQGACEKAEYKTLQSVSRSELPDYQTPDEPYIKQFIVTPNPNGGNFNATVELKEVANFKLVFYSGQGTVIAVKEIKSQSFSSVSLDLSSSVSDGIYMLQLITAQGIATAKVMINK
jgi:hypothetical protein